MCGSNKYRYFSEVESFIQNMSQQTTHFFFWFVSSFANSTSRLQTSCAKKNTASFIFMLNFAEVSKKGALFLSAKFFPSSVETFLSHSRSHLFPTTIKQISSMSFSRFIDSMRFCNSGSEEGSVIEKAQINPSLFLMY